MYVIAKTIDGCLKVGWKIGRTGWVGGRRSERTIQKSGAGNWGSRSEKGNSAMAWRTDFVMGVTDVTGTGGSRVPPPRLEAKSGRSYRTAPSSRALWLSELCVAHAHRRKMKNETRRSVRSREFLGGIRWLILIGSSRNVYLSLLSDWRRYRFEIQQFIRTARFCRKWRISSVEENLDFRAKRIGQHVETRLS